MANTDYEIRGSGAPASVATLSTAVNPGATVFSFTGLSTVAGVSILAGAAIMLGDEIVKLVSYTATTLTVARGCADTVPASHPIGTPLWFFENNTGSDQREYVAGETVGVKVLMKAGSTAMGIAASPPNQITFVGRAARPYPPGQVKVGANPWWQDPHALTSAAPSISLSWVHRDRVLQADVLVGHLEASIGPEVGTTYELEVYDNLGVLKSTIALTGTAATFTLVQASIALGLVPGAAGDTLGTALLVSRRDGLRSMQGYPITFTANVAGMAVGWGNAWGLAFGN